MNDYNGVDSYKIKDVINSALLSYAITENAIEHITVDLFDDLLKCVIDSDNYRFQCVDVFEKDLNNHFWLCPICGKIEKIDSNNINIEFVDVVYCPGCDYEFKIENIVDERFFQKYYICALKPFSEIKSYEFYGETIEHHIYADSEKEAIEKLKKIEPENFSFFEIIEY